MRGPGRNVKECLKKAHQSALQAVEIYNKPATPFRTGGYVVLMVIAWQSLFHAISFKRNIKPYYRKKNSKRFARIEGDYSWWDLTECAKQYYGGVDGPVRKNLEFFAKLRNKIEHRTIPELDPAIFGECQALLFNFDDLLKQEFGEKFALSESLYLPLQFTRAPKKSPRGKDASGWADVSTFVQAYRSTLGADVYGSNDYSWQVFLLPRVGGARSLADVAIEWIEYDPTKPDEMAQYEQVSALIKTRQVPVRNLDGYKPAQVAKLVAAAIERPFSVNHHHIVAWKSYGVRPLNGSSDPAACKGDFCSYDKLHKDYVYTQKWVDLLIRDLSNIGQYDALFKKKA
jgi:hypothetical protein